MLLVIWLIWWIHWKHDVTSFIQIALFTANCNCMLFLSSLSGKRMCAGIQQKQIGIFTSSLIPTIACSLNDIFHFASEGMRLCNILVKIWPWETILTIESIKVCNHWNAGRTSLAMIASKHRVRKALQMTSNALLRRSVPSEEMGRWAWTITWGVTYPDMFQSVGQQGLEKPGCSVVLFNINYITFMKV